MARVVGVHTLGCRDSCRCLCSGSSWSHTHMWWWRPGPAVGTMATVRALSACPPVAATGVCTAAEAGAGSQASMVQAHRWRVQPCRPVTEHRLELAQQQLRGHCLLACMPVAAGSSPRCMMVDASDRGWTRGMQMHS